jgi:hypothetical protein
MRVGLNQLHHSHGLILKGLELINQRSAGNKHAILFDSMYAANVVEGQWTARTNVDAAGKTAALLEEAQRHNDVRPIHVKGRSVHEYTGNGIADELAWWEGGPTVLPAPAGRRRGKLARAGGELRGARGAARGEGGGCTSGRCSRRCCSGCTSGRCDGRRCGCSARE